MVNAAINSLTGTLSTAGEVSLRAGQWKKAPPVADTHTLTCSI